MRMLPQRGFSRAIRRIRACSSGSMRGRPGLRLRPPSRCRHQRTRRQRVTVAGWTMSSVSRQFEKKRARKHQSRRSLPLRLRRAVRPRSYTISWWRSAMFSMSISMRA